METIYKILFSFLWAIIILSALAIVVIAIPVGLDTYFWEEAMVAYIITCFITLIATQLYDDL